MDLSHSLNNAELTVEIAGGIIVLYNLYPVYKKTKNKGLAWIGFGYILSLFLVIFNLLMPASAWGSAYQTYYILRRLGYITTGLVFPVGWILVLRFITGLDSALTLTCPKCKTRWELSSREAAQPVFTCAECGTEMDTAVKSDSHESH